MCLFIRLYPDMLPQQEDNSVTHKDWTEKEIQESINALSFYLTNMRTRVQSNVLLHQYENKYNQVTLLFCRLVV